MKQESENSPRYVVGIDLGTTNSAVGYIDLLDKGCQAQTFRISQLVAPDTIEARDSLPSFHYEPGRGEFAGDTPFVGVFARDHGAATPGRLVVSAKSWLSHSGVNREAALLPWHCAEDVTKLSPGAVSSRFLEHIRHAWDQTHPHHLLAAQDVVLTVPASFDEVARELTVDAARTAGLPKLCLLEEPQAAFYAWMSKHKQTETMAAGQTILVCDIGGGTTDLTLIEVEQGEGEAPLSYRRIAVGEHLLLGGDNLDLALAYDIEKKLGESDKLPPAVWSVLVRRCQQAKETLLQTDAPEHYTISLPTRGRSVIGGSRQIDLRRGDVVQLLVDGFLPAANRSDRPDLRQSGFQEFGLPYAPDAAITRYVMAFLADQGDVRPDYILFNGGFFESEVLRARFLNVLSAALDWQPKVLQTDRLDLAVAHGAAEFGRVRRGLGTRITGGLARAYYLGVGQNNAEAVAVAVAVCLLPAGLEEGTSVHLSDRKFKLHINRPVEFPLYTSSVRTQDQPGELIPINEENMRPMPSIKTVIGTSKKKALGTVDVELHAIITEIGTIEVWCKETGGNREWRLQFDARAATQTDRAVKEDVANRLGLVDEEIVRKSITHIEAVLGPARRDDPGLLLKSLERITETERNDWPPALLRRWFEAILLLDDCRQASPALEARWLNLAGYTLRPGYGFAADDWRVSQAWKIKQAGVVNLRNEMCRAEWWILWRRMAGGLTENQQQELANPLIKQWNGRIKNPTAQIKKQSGFLFGDHESAEVWRLLGSLERLPIAQKKTLGELLITWIERKGVRISNGAAVWALGRIGAREPSYGPLDTVVPAETAEAWIARLVGIDDWSSETLFALMHLTRKTGDRYRDVSGDVCEQVIDRMKQNKAPERMIELVRQGGLLDAEEQDHTFGEALPPGLRLA